VLDHRPAISGLTRTWRSILDLVFPPHCVACGRMGAWLCEPCLTRIQPAISQSARAPNSALDAVYSLSDHVDPLRTAVHSLKYQGVRVLCPILGDLLRDRWSQTGGTADIILPVPLHPTKRRQRGYNQSELLARELGTRIEVPVRVDCLARTRSTRSQVGLSVQERWENVWDAFAVTGGEVKGGRLLLIDDVYTSGATLEACAYVLRDAGADSVSALTLTRASHGRDAVPSP